MSNVLQFYTKAADIKAVTCGCDCQEFSLVVDAHGKPDFIYCTGCQHRLSTVVWCWTDDHKPAA